MTIEDVVGEFARLARAAGVNIIYILLVLAGLAVVIVFVKGWDWKKLPQSSPDPQDHKSPPIVLNPDGSIPTSNPTIPPPPEP